MLAKVHSAAVLGIDSYPIEIEVNAGWGQPAVIIVGLPDAAVKESRDRVKTAIENSGFKHVMGRTTIKLAPADIHVSRRGRSRSESRRGIATIPFDHEVRPPRRVRLVP